VAVDSQSHTFKFSWRISKDRGSAVTMITFAVLGPMLDVALLVLLLVVGLVIIILLAKVLWFALPAAIVALVVWYFTGNVLWAGVAFLVIALISLVKRSQS